MKKRLPADWPGAALRLAARLGPAPFHPETTAWAAGRPRAERWAVAISGGADSVALLLLLWACWPQRRGRLVALHFDHALRGAESRGDARFCRSLCRGLGVPFQEGRWRRPKGPVAEARARAARFGFLERAMASQRIRAAWFGHQQDDVAETLLMRLSRGSGSAGLAAPRPVHAFAAARAGGRPRFHLRPLLGLKKAQIAAALRAEAIPWREDSSNRSGAHFRNRLRRDVLPRWIRASQRDALAGAALSRELLEEDDRALEAWVDQVQALDADRTLSVARLSGKPRAVVRRALHRWLSLQPKAGELSRQGFETLLGSVERGRSIRHSLGSHGFAVIRKGRLSFEPLHKAAAH